MLKPNKYLKEIGIDENYWLFKEMKENQNKLENSKPYDKRYIEDEDGFIDAEFFNLDATLSLEIYSRLCYYRDHLIGYPGFLDIKYNDSDIAFKKWKEMLDAMIEAFKLKILEGDEVDLLLSNDKNEKKAGKLLSKNKRKKINYGMRLFIKYYDCLWW